MAIKRANKFTGLAMASVALAIPLTTAAAPLAQAGATGCNHFVQTDGNGYGYCSGGTGEFRISIGCKGWINFGIGFTQYGDWRRAGGGQASIARCPIGSWNWGGYTTIYFRQ